MFSQKSSEEREKIISIIEVRNNGLIRPEEQKPFYGAKLHVELDMAGGCLLFSLKFSSAGKGPFMAGKAKDNMCQRYNFLWGGVDLE